jgi:hypothetical protein
VLSYPSRMAAIYVPEHEKRELYVYVEVSDEDVLKMIVAETFEEIAQLLPERALEAVNAASGRSPHLFR